MIRFVHTADLHASRTNMDKVLASLRTLQDTVKREAVDLVALAGDLWQSGIYATGASRFPEYIEAIRSIADIAPVVMIYGTPSHDLAGSLDVFETLRTAYGITILQPGVKYFLTLERRVVAEKQLSPGMQKRMLLFGIPEPTKEWALRRAAELGKDKSDDAIKTGLRTLFTGLAAQRAEHADIPCVVLYHGQIAGATMQNERMIGSGQGIVVGRDDLAIIDADYYALGDIHEPQQIGALPMYYPGSAYPITWGETHQAGFNLVELDDSVTVSRRDYPHPRNKKLAGKAHSAFDPSEVTGYRVWFEITATREEARTVDTEDILRKLIDAGALLGSRVTLKIEAAETVRAGEIAKSRRLRDKVEIYAKNSTQEIADSVLVKADELEQVHTETVTRGAHLRINRLRLRGAIGVWKGQGKDEIDIDLTHYDQGIVALVGENGAGKTTLIENMHPWPQMLTRDGALSAHFRLRDSYRELFFTDERTGDEYRALIQVNGATKTGGAEYHLWRNDEPVPGINGRKDPYVEAINTLFGSIALYQRTAFVSQRSTKGNPDLADATKGERKQLFRELAGLDYLQLYADAAKEHAKTLQEEIANDIGWIEAVKDAVSGLPELEAIEQRVDKELAAARENEHTAKEKMRDREAELNDLNERQSADTELRKRASEIETRIARDSKMVEEHQRSCEAYRKIISAKDEAQERIENYEELENERKKLEASKATKLQARNTALELYNTRVASIRQTRNELEDKKRVVERDRDALLQRREAAKEAIERFGERLDEPRHDKCPSCGEPLPWAEGEDAKRAEWQERLEEAQRNVWEIDKKLPDSEDAIESLSLQIAQQLEPQKPKLDRIIEDDELERIAQDMKFLDIESARRITSEADQAAVRLEETEKQITTCTAQIENDNRELQSLRTRFNDEIAQWVSTAKQDLLIARAAHEEALSKVAALETELKTTQHQIAVLQEKKQELAEREKAVGQKRKNADEWTWLQKACGPDGVQALELDALAPSIEEIANKLLRSAYGSRFMVHFETTKMDSRGKKQLEDFLIQVQDTDHGTEQELATLSGGEAVWIKRALYDAFGIVRARNAGIRFLTCFQDEADGALDPEAKENYARMLVAAHHEAGRAHTILITHSREVQELVGQTINISTLNNTAA